MKTIVRHGPTIALIALSSALSINAYAADPCFTVKGNTVSVMNLSAKHGTAHVIDVEHMTSVSSMVSNGPDANSIQINGIKRDAEKNVTSFDATIDDKAFHYPNDACK